MTMVAGYHSEQGVIVISDSRATWGPEENRHFQDSLQKIVSLGEGLVLAYAGDVRAADRIIRELRSRIAKKSNLRIARKLAAEIPRIAKHFYALHAKGGSAFAVDIMVAGREANGKIGLWVFSSPNFAAKHIENGLVIIGSGYVAGEILSASMPPVPENPTLKNRADALMAGLDSALRIKGVATVGGMFQVLTISPSEGIKPLTHGYVDIDPDGPASAKFMTISKGVWTQEDAATGEKTPLLQPARLASPALKTTVDYVVDPQQRPKWHVTRFLLCHTYGTSPTGTIFKGVATIFNVEAFPFDAEVLAVVGFWGTAGTHKLKVVLEIDGNQSTVGEQEFRNDYLPEEVEFALKIKLKAERPGPAFLTAHIDDQLLSRRAIRFSKLDGPVPSDPAERSGFAARNNQRSIAEQKVDLDPDLPANIRAGVAFFVLCQSADLSGDYEFKQEFKAAYWKKYPLLLRINVAISFRAEPGPHEMKLVLVDAANRREWSIDGGKCMSSSACIMTTFQGAVVANIPKPGYYFVNAMLDGKRLATRLLVAETEKAAFSYTLRPQDAARVASGELLILTTRSQQAPG